MHCVFWRRGYGGRGGHILRGWVKGRRLHGGRRRHGWVGGGVGVGGAACAGGAAGARMFRGS